MELWEREWERVEGVLKRDNISTSDWCLKCCGKAAEAQKLLGLDFQNLFLKHASYFQ